MAYVPKKIFQNGKQTKASMRYVYCDQRKRAKRRGLAYELSFDQWLALVSMNCYLCNGKPAGRFKFSPASNYSHYPSVVFQGIDRIDNSVGYVIGNVAPCCKNCNYIKYKMSLSGLKKHILKIVRFQNWR